MKEEEEKVNSHVGQQPKQLAAHKGPQHHHHLGVGRIQAPPTYQVQLPTQQRLKS